jgi:TPR repeat protein
MRSLRLALLFSLCMPNAAFAKDKPRITIQIVNSEASQREYTRTIPGRRGTAETNCTTNGTTNGTINDYGIGPIQTNSDNHANTNCTTTTTAATPPRTVTRSITQEHVSAIMPDGRHVILWCQQGYRRCDDLQPGNYEAEIDGNALFIFVHELTGKERKVKYKAVSVEEASAAVSAPPASAAPATPNSEVPPMARNKAILPECPASPEAERVACTSMEQGAANGDPLGQLTIGGIYESGNKYVRQDYAQAAAWYRLSADQGNALAQDALGTLYETGRGVKLDDAEAANWFRKASQQGIDNSQLQLATLYESGRGVPLDYKQAAEWYRKSADQGDLASQLALGYSYRDGEGVPQNYSQAAYWFQKAAMADYAMAQWMLGDLFEQGQGVPQNYAEAYFWYNLAAAGLPKDGATNSGEIVRKIMEDRGRVEAHLTPSDLSREQERARKWFEDHPAETH